MIYTELAFWKASAERAIKTAAQTAVALIGADQVGILSLDWGEIGAVVATATVLSVLTSVASGVGGSPAIGHTERLDVPTVVGDYSGAVANESWEEPVEDEPDEVVGDDVEYVEPLTDAVDEESDYDWAQDALDAALAADIDETPPPAGYEPRH